MSDERARRDGDLELPKASLVRPYVESLGDAAEEAPGPSVRALELETAVLPQLPSAETRPALREAGPAAQSEAAPERPVRRRSATGLVVIGATAALAVGSGYLAFTLAGNSGEASHQVAAIVPSVPMPSPAPTFVSESALSPSITPTTGKPAPPTGGPGAAGPGIGASPFFGAAGGDPAPTGTDLATGRTITDTGHAGTHVVTNAIDGDPQTYWEGTGQGFPESVTIDLGSRTTVGRIVLRLPPYWAKRVESLSVQVGMRESHYRTAKAAAPVTFDPDTGNQAVITFEPTRCRFVQVTFSANSASPAGQISEIEIFAS